MGVEYPEDQKTPQGPDPSAPHPVWQCKTHRKLHQAMVLDDCVFCLLCLKNLLLSCKLTNLKSTESVCLGPTK